MSRSGQRSKSPLSALSTNEVALIITAVNPNFVKKDSQRMKKAPPYKYMLKENKRSRAG